MDDRSDDLTIRMTDAEPAPERARTGPVGGDRYRVVNRLGKGGMGEVMTVRDETIGREVALKRIRKANPSARLIARFLREAAIQSRLEHPAIVPVHDIGSDAGGLPFFTMRKLAGTTLAKILAGDRAAFSLQRLLRGFAEVCLAVEFAHVRGVVHRDLKPDNIVLGDFGEVYVLDWGVAKVVGEPDGELEDLSGSSGSSDSGESSESSERVGSSERSERVGGSERSERVMTIPGTAIGTPGYMAPEQVRGVIEVDGRADVYSLGCILYEILAGAALHPPGAAGLATALHGLDPRPSVRRLRDVPPELDALCVDAIATDRDARLATARELGDRVQRFLDGDRDLALRQRLAAEQLAAAHAAFAGADHGGAMRRAAAALALDPALAGAAELVGRLMLEPPRATPPEVEQAIREDDARAGKDNVRVGIWVYVVFLAFTPLLWWIGPAGSPYAYAVAVIVLLNMGVCYWATKVRTEGREWVLAVMNCVLLIVISRGYSPFLIAPALAIVNTMAIVFTPTRSRVTSALGMSLVAIAGVLGPWLLERTGVLSVTTTVSGEGILLRAAAIGDGENATHAVAALYVVAIIAAAAGLAKAMQARERAAKHHLHMQAWQLRQLVPVVKS